MFPKALAVLLACCASFGCGRRGAGASRADAAAPTGGGGPHPPIVCRGAEHIELHGVVINNPGGAAVLATEACRVVLTNCVLFASVGVDASGSAQVALTQCQVTGATAALIATGSARVNLIATRLSGGVQRSGQGSITLM